MGHPFESGRLDHSALAQLEEHTAVNCGVLGSKPRGGDYVFLNDYPSFKKASVAKWLRRLFSKEETVRSNRTRCKRGGAVVERVGLITRMSDVRLIFPLIRV